MNTKERILEKLNESGKTPVKPQDLRSGQTYTFESKGTGTGTKKFKGFAVVDDADGSQLDAPEFKDKMFADWGAVVKAAGSNKPAQMIANVSKVVGHNNFGIMAIFDGVYRDGKPGPIGGITGHKATWHAAGKPIKYFK